MRDTIYNNNIHASTANYDKVKLVLKKNRYFVESPFTEMLKNLLRDEVISRSRIFPEVIFLMTKAGVTKGDIGKVIALDPQLVGCSIINKLDVNVKYFLSLGIYVNVLGEMIADFPMLLRYNLDILRPKYQYLRRVMVRPLKDLIEFPRFFSYSLEDRIIPRYKIMVASRVNFKLRYMLATSDDEFDQRVQAAIEKRERFERGETDFSFSDSETSIVIRPIQEIL